MVLASHTHASKTPRDRGALAANAGQAGPWKSSGPIEVLLCRAGQPRLSVRTCPFRLLIRFSGPGGLGLQVEGEPLDAPSG